MYSLFGWCRRQTGAHFGHIPRHRRSARRYTMLRHYTNMIYEEPFITSDDIASLPECDSDDSTTPRTPFQDKRPSSISIPTRSRTPESLESTTDDPVLEKQESSSEINVTWILNKQHHGPDAKIRQLLTSAQSREALAAQESYRRELRKVTEEANEKILNCHRKYILVIKSICNMDTLSTHTNPSPPSTPQPEKHEPRQSSTATPGDKPPRD